MNPAITLAFHRLDKVEPWDAAFYIVAQFAGGVGGVLLAQALLGSAFTAPPVRDIATVPGPAGALAAFAGEFFISLTIYFVAPTLGMQAAIDAYRWATGRRHAICAKLAHDIDDVRCIFRCGHRPNLLRGRA